MTEKRRQNLTMRIINKLFSISEDATPPPWKILLLCLVSLFSSAFTITFLFPFLPEMVLYFGYTEEEKGYYVGLVAGSMFAGRAVGSYFWGWLSDIKGRKPVIIITVLGNGIFSLMFGFTQNLAMALATRFLTGLANGVVGTCKTILFEVSDNTNQAVGMSMISLAWGSGIILGPAIGGYLASPAKKYPDIFDSDGFFGQFPYVLPGIVAFIIADLAAVLVAWQLPETRILKKKADSSESKNNTELEVINDGKFQKVELLRSESRQSAGKFMSCENLHLESEIVTYMVHRENELQSLDDDTAKRQHSATIEKMSPSVTKELIVLKSHNREENGHAQMNWNEHEAINRGSELETDLGKEHSALLQLNKAQESEMNGHTHAEVCVVDVKLENKKTHGRSSLWTTFINNKVFTLLRVSDIRQSILLYTIFSFAVIGIDDILTIWASTDPFYDGLGFSTDEIGTLLGSASVPLLLLNVFIFPVMVKKLSIIKVFLFWSVILVLTSTAMPMLHVLFDQKAVLWATLLILQCPLRVATSCAFTATSLLVNNSSTRENVGAVNGIATTATAIARTIAPAVGGSIFAWSISYGRNVLGAPFDVNLAFFVFGLVFYITIFMAIVLPRHLNYQSKKETVEH